MTALCKDQIFCYLLITMVLIYKGNGQTAEARGTTRETLSKQDWNYTDIHLPKNSCARAYLNWKCTAGNPYYTDLMGSKHDFSIEFHGKVEAIKVREGCNLTIYEEEDFEGDVFDIEGTSEEAIPTIGSYKCTCSPNSYTAKPKLSRPASYPPLIDIPNSINEVSSLLKGKLGRHIGLLSAKASLKTGRSSKNAYILVLGTTGSGKSSAINLLFANSNITNQGSKTRGLIDSGIHEYRVQVPVDELGINNSELRIIDTPGLGDTRGLEQDAKFFATLDDYLSTHEELHDRLPNVVLIFHKFYDNRFNGQSSDYVKVLRGLDSFRGKITDDTYSNVIFVFSHFCSVTKATQRKPKQKLLHFKRVIEDFTQFPKPIVMAVAENKAEEHDLPMVNGYYKLPNGDYYPRNLFDKIMESTGSTRDPVGNAVIRNAFRDSSNFNISSSTYRLVQTSNTKVTKYLGILTAVIFSDPDTEISRLLAKTFEQMDSKLKQKFPDTLLYLRKALDIRGIKTKADIPKTTLEILVLLSSLKQNEAILLLLQNALGLKPPIYQQNVITGHSYNVFKDMPLSKSPYKLGDMINSDIGYVFPSAMTCNVQNKLSDVFRIVPNRTEYLKLLASDLGIEDNIAKETFTGEIKPGFNVQEEQFLNDSCSLSAVKEIRTFELTLNDRPELTPELIKAVKSLRPFNETDHENVNTWKDFFEEYRTHVVKSVSGGGAIVIHLKSNKVCSSDLSEALLKLVKFFEAADSDPIVLAYNSTNNWKRDGIQHRVSFLGGDNSTELTDFTEMSLEAASNLLRNWKKSLRFNPAILKTEMKMLPISEVVKKIGQNVSSEIQKATSLLFNSSLKYVPLPKPTEQRPGSDRDHTQSANNELFLTLIKTLMDESRAANTRMQVLMTKINKDQNEAEIRREAASQKIKWEREPAAIRENLNKQVGTNFSSETQRAESLIAQIPSNKLPGSDRDGIEVSTSTTIFTSLIEKIVEEFRVANASAEVPEHIFRTPTSHTPLLISTSNYFPLPRPTGEPFGSDEHFRSVILKILEESEKAKQRMDGLLNRL